MERQRKHNFSSRISAQGSRFIFTDDCGEQRCVIVYVCARKDKYVYCTHTQTQIHAKTVLGADTQVGGLLFTQSWQCL